MLQILLEDQGWDTEQAASGEEALARGRSGRPGSTRWWSTTRCPASTGWRSLGGSGRRDSRGRSSSAPPTSTPEVEREAKSPGCRDRQQERPRGARGDGSARGQGSGAAMREGEFLSIVSHELKTPIAVITGLADTLSERRQQPDGGADRSLSRSDQPSGQPPRSVGRRSARSLPGRVGNVSAQPRSGQSRRHRGERAGRRSVAARQVRRGSTIPGIAVGRLPTRDRLGAGPRQSAHQRVSLRRGRTISVEARGTPDGVVVTVADDGDGVPG